ncbi:MAG: alpha/beta hydrolase, partial [Acidobacteria bacterium]|nr:alpha/beta hydrolase [Acidobacteriota bacterium]
PLRDTRAVLAWLRSGVSGLSVDTARIGVLGFSAGGHLAATLSTGVSADEHPDEVIDRPDLSVLAYPVISMVSDYHVGSVESLLGPAASLPTRRGLSAELAVDSATPPTFLWHTADDGAVSVQNSLAFAGALARNSVPFELHVFPEGRHGLGLAREQAGASAWPMLCARWLEGHGWAEVAAR